MSKPRGVKWLEEQTGERLDRKEAVSESRHLSLRISTSMYDELERLAAERAETVSRTARRLLDDGIAHVNNPNREAIDVAIAALERLRRSIDPSAA